MRKLFLSVAVPALLSLTVTACGDGGDVDPLNKRYVVAMIWDRVGSAPAVRMEPDLTIMTQCFEGVLESNPESEEVILQQAMLQAARAAGFGEGEKRSLRYWHESYLEAKGANMEELDQQEERHPDFYEFRRLYGRLDRFREDIFEPRCASDVYKSRVAELRQR